MKNGHNVDVSTSTDVPEVIKLGGNIFEDYESVIYRENSEISPSRKLMERQFALRQ